MMSKILKIAFLANVLGFMLFFLIATAMAQSRMLCSSPNPTVVECDFSRYHPLIVSHALVKAAVKKVEPIYPVTARNARAQGVVEVRILVDNKGNVKRACAIAGSALLRPSAEVAAREWKFRKNFGYQRKQYGYIQASLFFTFKSTP